VQRVPPKRVLLTGTPIQNSTEELWTLLNYIAPFDFYSLDQFMEKFGNLKDSSQVEELQEAIRPYVLRRMKENVEKSIPPKEETIIDIELTTLQKQYYRAIYEKNRNFLSRGCEKSNIPRLINIEMELRKCCNHPWLIKGVEDKEVDPHAPNDVYCQKTVEASGKMVLLDKLLPKLRSEGHRVLICSQMRQVLDILEFYVEYKGRCFDCRSHPFVFFTFPSNLPFSEFDRILGYAYERLDGHTHGNDRQRAIDAFSREGSDRFIFLLSTRAGGVGLNLTAADTVIIFDSDWNPQQDVQAQARVHRIGQQSRVASRIAYQVLIAP
jgi:chromodomain-helicase-DNA-binding protein 7